MMKVGHPKILMASNLPHVPPLLAMYLIHSRLDMDAIGVSQEIVRKVSLTKLPSQNPRTKKKLQNVKLQRQRKH